MRAMNWSHADFQHVEELNASEQSLALCNNRVQAMVYTVGHPNASVSKAAKLCNATIAKVDGPVIDKLVADNDYYRKATVPGGMYAGTADDTETFGVGATFVSSTNSDEQTIYVIVSAVFDNFDRFKSLHPAFANLKETDMISAGLTAPLHKGAVRYYKERGWIK